MVPSLSTFSSPVLSSNMIGVSPKQFQRTYPGNYKINIPLCLSASNDFKSINYSNFYLSQNCKFSDIFEVDSKKLKSQTIFTPIQCGDDYLQFTISNPDAYASVGRYQEHFNYGDDGFTTELSDSTYFTVKILDNNTCNIYYTYNYKKYYLLVDDNDEFHFVKDKLLTFDTDVIQPQDFKYLFSETTQAFQLFKDTAGGVYFVTKSGNKLVYNLVTSNNPYTYISTAPFKIQRSIYTTPNISLNTSFITYDNDNTLNYLKSVFDLSNNFLFHRKYSSNRSEIDIITLKNQLLQSDLFSSANNLLSASDNSIVVDGLRDYASISQTIPEETSDELDLNYVFYNKSYTIKPGSNYFTSPSSIKPFSRLNINDTKFVESGAFSFDTPQYADKVYHLSNDKKNYDNGQYLLCTWLSGSPIGTDKIWIDRYYYPDRIEKEAAFGAIPAYSSTYDEYVENLVSTNSAILSSVDEYKIFDKISDLVFVENQEYLYERINIDSSIESLSSNINICNNYTENYPSNYFKDINLNNKFSVGFYFSGDDKNWSVSSDHNDITCGLTFEKDGDYLTISYDLYDPVGGEEGYHHMFTKRVKIKQNKENFVCVSVNGLTGDGYFFLNNEVVHTFDNSEFQVYEYVNKQLLYGDFFVIKGSEKTNILTYSNNDIYDPIITDGYIPSNLVFILPILGGKAEINDIHITLPCGMRNSVDNVEYLQNVCGSSIFKSNSVNIHLKNTNITNENVIKGIKDSITTGLAGILPINTKINNIQLDNYK